MTTVEDFRSLKNTKGTYSKVLSAAQLINGKQTAEFIKNGFMPELTLQERQIMTLCDGLADGHKLPKVVRRETSFYVDLSIRLPRNRN